MIIPIAGAAVAASTAAQAANTAARAALIASRRGGGGGPMPDRCPHCGNELAKPAKPVGWLRRLNDRIGYIAEIVLLDHMHLVFAVIIGLVLLVVIVAFVGIFTSS